MTFNDVQAYMNYVRSINPKIVDLSQIEFKDTTILTTLQSENEKGYSGEVYEAPITAPDVREVSYDYDPTLLYEITCDEDGKILSFSFFEKGKNTPVRLNGRNAEKPFFEFMGALGKSIKTPAKVTNIFGR